jgi:hypothetical protein
MWLRPCGFNRRREHYQQWFSFMLQLRAAASACLATEDLHEAVVLNAIVTSDRSVGCDRRE